MVNTQLLSCIYKGKIVYSCEDIGRHNALDKAIGYALMHDYDFHECAVFTTGRLPIDMITKVIRAGIPLVASKKDSDGRSCKTGTGIWIDDDWKSEESQDDAIYAV